MPSSSTSHPQRQRQPVLPCIQPPRRRLVPPVRSFRFVWWGGGDSGTAQSGRNEGRRLLPAQEGGDGWMVLVERASHPRRGSSERTNLLQVGVR